MFKLVIECSKDIDNLSINFTDGTSVVTESKPKETKEAKVKEIKESKKPERKPLDSYLDTEDDYEIQQEVVQKPFIQDVQRPAKVSEELQNLDL
jgi:hypothetical protein